LFAIHETEAVRWENDSMQKTFTSTAVLLAAGMMLAGIAPAQQAPASSTTKPTAKSTATGTAKTHTGTTAKKTPETPLVLTTPKQKASYAIGTSIGRKLHDDDLDVDTTILVRAIKDAQAGKKSQLTDDEMRSALVSYQEEATKQLATRNKTQGDAYRAANKAKEGVVTLPSGLQYKILQAGTGPKPSASDSVVCNYKGTFVDGKEFDSSYGRGEPATFPVSGVIKGWTEALQLMPVGSKWQLVIPPDLAYGEQGRRGMPPNSTLVFEVELLKIAEKEKPAPEAPTPQGNPAAVPAHPADNAAPATPPAQPDNKGTQPQTHPQQ
jgi:FKBP-type peptidyl-prolyl cis-trans isomerase